MATDTNTTKIVGLLVEASKLDTVYRDLYLKRARQLLSATLDESAYRAIGSSEQEIEDLVRRSRSAALQRDWGQVAELSAKADGLRQRKAAMRTPIGPRSNGAVSVFNGTSPENSNRRNLLRLSC